MMYIYWIAIGSLTIAGLICNGLGVFYGKASLRTLAKAERLAEKCAITMLGKHQ